MDLLLNPWPVTESSFLIVLPHSLSKKSHIFSLYSQTSFGLQNLVLYRLKGHTVPSEPASNHIRRFLHSSTSRLPYLPLAIGVDSDLSPASVAQEAAPEPASRDWESVQPNMGSRTGVQPLCAASLPMIPYPYLNVPPFGMASPKPGFWVIRTCQLA